MTKKHALSISAGVFSVVVAYAFFAGLWILLSDQAMWLLFSDQATLERVSMAKGWTFVAITTLLLYFLVRRLVGQLVAAHQRELAFERERELPPPMLVAIANASSDAIFAKDSQGRYLLFNPAASRFVGKPEEEALGHDDRDLFPADQAEMLMAAGRRVMESGQTETSEEVLDTPEGMKVFLATKGPLRDELGRTFGIFGISRDITARKNAEALLYVSQERLRLLLDHAPAALAMFDREMRYLEVSRRWREDYFLGGRDIIGHSHYEVFPEISDAWKAVHKRALAGETVSADEERFARHDGTVQWLRWEVRPWRGRDGAIGGIVIFSEDITRRKVADEELVRRNAELERFARAATERELRMIALKREVNALARRCGQQAPYDVSFADEPAAGKTP